MCVGQARVQGASKQNRQRLASILALCGAKGGLMSAKFFSYSASANFGARFFDHCILRSRNRVRWGLDSHHPVNELYDATQREQRKKALGSLDARRLQSIRSRRQSVS